MTKWGGSTSALPRQRPTWQLMCPSWTRGSLLQAANIITGLKFIVCGSWEIWKRSGPYCEHVRSI